MAGMVVRLVDGGRGVGVARRPVPPPVTPTPSHGPTARTTATTTGAGRRSPGTTATVGAELVRSVPRRGEVRSRITGRYDATSTMSHDDAVRGAKELAKASGTTKGVVQVDARVGSHRYAIADLDGPTKGNRGSWIDAGAGREGAARLTEVVDPDGTVRATSSTLARAARRLAGATQRSMSKIAALVPATEPTGRPRVGDEAKVTLTVDGRQLSRTTKVKEVLGDYATAFDAGTAGRQQSKDRGNVAVDVVKRADGTYTNVVLDHPVELGIAFSPLGSTQVAVGDGSVYGSVRNERNSFLMLEWEGVHYGGRLKLDMRARDMEVWTR